MLEWLIHKAENTLFNIASQKKTSAARGRSGSVKITSQGWIISRTLRGSFSAVSTPNFARKYSLESSWRDLQDLHAFAPLRPQYFRNVLSIFFEFFGKILQKFVIFEFFSLIFAKILMKFYRNFADILENVEILNFPKFMNFLGKIPEFWKNSVRSWVWLLCSPSCLRLTQFNFLSHIGISPSGSLESRSVCTCICTYVSLCTLFASRPSGGHF